MLLGIIDALLEVLEKLVQVPAPLELKHVRKANGFIMENMATWNIIVFNISVLLACKLCKIRMLFWML